MAFFKALDPRVLYATWMSPIGRMISVPEEAAAGLISGALLGFLLGCVVGALRAGTSPKHVAEDTPKARMSPIARVAIAAAVGLALGLVNTGTSDVPRHFATSEASCGDVQNDITGVQGYLNAHLFQDGYNRATQGLLDNNGCDEPQKSVNAGALYYMRAISEQRMEKPFQADAEQAHNLLSACVSQYAKDPADSLGRQCQTMLISSQRYITQHFCEDSTNLSLKADREIGSHEYTNAIDDANKAVAAAAKCQNAYNYAGKGFALAERGGALVLSGNRGGLDDLRIAEPLLSRCISELSGADHDQDLLKECRSEHEAVISFFKAEP